MTPTLDTKARQLIGNFTAEKALQPGTLRLRCVEMEANLTLPANLLPFVSPDDNVIVSITIVRTQLNIPPDEPPGSLITPQSPGLIVPTKPKLVS